MMICLAIDAFFPSCRYVIRDAISCCPPDYNDRNRLLVVEGEWTRRFALIR